MNTIKPHFQPCLRIQKPSFKLIQASPHGTRNSSIEQSSLKKKHTYTYPLVRSAKGGVTYLPSRKASVTHPSLTYVKQQLSLVQDPLWKRVCADAVHLMGPVALQIFQVQLSLPQERTLDLYCHTEEIARFLQCYNFVILESLRRYFPSLKHIRVNQYPR